MKTGLLLTNFQASKHRSYIWDIVGETVDHYKNFGDFYAISCGSCDYPAPRPDSIDCGLDHTISNKEELKHNCPQAITKAVLKCDEEKCDKILIVSPFLRVNNFEFMKSKLCFLKDRNEYIEDTIYYDKQLNPNFIFGNTAIIKKAWTKRQWNYNISEPSKNVFENFANIASTKSLISNSVFVTKQDLKAIEVQVFWKTNIMYHQY
jgi:hypothetical protein